MMNPMIILINPYILLVKLKISMLLNIGTVQSSTDIHVYLFLAQTHLRYIYIYIYCYPIITLQQVVTL